MKHAYPITKTSNGIFHVTDNLTIQEYPEGLTFCGNEHTSFIDVLSMPDYLLLYIDKVVGGDFSRKIADHIYYIGNFEILFDDAL